MVDFFVIALDFHGGHDESCFRAAGCGLRGGNPRERFFGRVSKKTYTENPQKNTKLYGRFIIKNVGFPLFYKGYECNSILTVAFPL